MTAYFRWWVTNCRFHENDLEIYIFLHKMRWWKENLAVTETETGNAWLLVNFLNFPPEKVCLTFPNWSVSALHACPLARQRKWISRLMLSFSMEAWDHSSHGNSTHLDFSLFLCVDTQILYPWTVSYNSVATIQRKEVTMLSVIIQTVWHVKWSMHAPFIELYCIPSNG